MTAVGLLCVMSGIALFLRIGEARDYVGIILPGVIIAISGGATTGIALTVAAISGIEQSKQGLVAGLQQTAGQAGAGLGLAITAEVLVAATATASGAASPLSVAAQLSSFHAGLLVAAASAALGALIALVGIRPPSEAPSDKSAPKLRFLQRLSRTRGKTP